MLVRLGNVLYWASVIAAVSLTAILLAVVVTDGVGTAGKSLGAAFSLVVGGAVWLIGWAVRYVLSGQR